ncbi:hypothetical protein GC175_04995 [bacterium]|nr:hypothetical protein [bacterium]
MNMNGNGHGNSILSTFTERQPEIATAKVLRHARKRAQSVAATLTRKGAAAASAELINESVNVLIALCYETDGNLGRVNVDGDGKLLVPSPWGRNGRYRFGLRVTEADVLRLHCYRLQEVSTPAPLFTYDPSVRSWFLNVFDYAEYAQAVSYWKKAGMDAGTYRTLAETVRNQRTGST